MLTALLIAATHFSAAQSVEPEGRTYSLRPITLKKGADVMKFETYAKEELEKVYRMVPGVAAHIAKSDRGTDTGEYVLFYFFDSKATRNYYFPEENGTEPSRGFQEMAKHVEKTLRGLYEFVEQEPASLDYADYVIIE